jgi:hypothetical protein
MRSVTAPLSCHCQPIGKANCLLPDDEESSNANQYEHADHGDYDPNATSLAIFLAQCE